MECKKIRHHQVPIYRFAVRGFFIVFLLSTSLLFATDVPLTYEVVKDLVESHHITKIEDLLPLLPEDYRGSFTLMRKSGSLQGATESNPRAILFGKDAKLIMSFNGDPSQRGYNSLEIIQYRDETKTFDFKRINFPSLSSHSSATAKVTYDEDGRNCVGCHRSSSPRPNWESYDLWSGAYGSVDDTIVIGSNEDESLKTFAQKMAAHPRYKYLVPDTKDFKHENSASVISVRDRYALATLPNFRFSFMLNRLNYERIAELLRKTPDFKSYQYAIYGAILNCENIETFIPPALSYRFPRTPKDFIKQTEKDTDASFEINLERDDHPASFEDKGEYHPQNNDKYLTTKQMVGKVRFLLENRGISMEDWSMGFNPSAYTFSDGEHYFRDVTMSFSTELASVQGFKPDRVDLERVYTSEFVGTRSKDFKGTYRVGGGGPANCALLKSASLDALNKLSLKSPDGDLPAHRNTPPVPSGDSHQ